MQRQITAIFVQKQMLWKKSTLGAIAILVLVASPLGAFAQDVQESSYQATNDAAANIAQTSDLNNTVIQQDDEQISGKAMPFARKGIFRRRRRPSK